MPKFSALIAVVAVFLVVPALASAAPTGSHISTPANPAYVTADNENPGALHVAGSTSGGTGNVDLRCYFGPTSALLASNVAVVNGAFATDVALTDTLMNVTLGYPSPYLHAARRSDRICANGSAQFG